MVVRSRVGGWVQGVWSVLVVAALVAHTSVAAADAQACQVVIGACHAAPLSTPQGSGVIDQIVVQAFQRIGVAACIRPLPCERSLRDTNEGRIDGDLLRYPAVLAGRYAQLAVVPEVLYELPINAFVARADLHPSKPADLVNLRVSYVRGWKVLEERVKAKETHLMSGPEQMFQPLAAGQLDTVICERLTGIQIAKDLGLSGVRVVDPPLFVTPQHLILNNKHQAWLAPLAQALRAMKKDGSYAAAFAAANVEPYTAQTAPSASVAYAAPAAVTAVAAKK